VDVLEFERLRHHMGRRTELLNALVLRHAGFVDLERSPTCPKVERPPRLQDRGEQVDFMWYMPLHIRKVFDACNEAVSMSAHTWVVYLLHRWLNLPFPPPPEFS
jgi:hypothetical protein